MLNKDTVVKITNRDNSHVGYSVPELNNLRRHFMPGETKEITMDELRKLSWTPGGSSVLKNHFIIHNAEAVEELVPGAEPEYFYDSNDVEKLLREGTLDQLKDALDFAPEGVVSLIKDKAVDIKVNDVQKRDAIREATGFDVSKAIVFNEMSQEENATEVKARRTNPMGMDAATDEDAGAPKRRTSVYSVKKS